MGGRGAWLAICLSLACGCDEQPRPWRGQPRGELVDESKPFLPGAQRQPLLGDAGLGAFASEAGQDVPEVVEDPLRSRVSRVGGLWTSCYARFEPTEQPLKDVTRLGLMCGPLNGMTQIGGTFRGELKGAAAARHTFSARAGDCYRLFAVAAKVEDLDVVVLSSRGSRLTSDQTDDNWPIVDPERPFCTFDDDTFTVELSSERRGGDGARGGPYALQIWKLQAGK